MRSVLVTVALLAISLATPSLASANWKDKNKELSEDASVTFSGNLSISGTTGSVVCAAELETTLTAGTASGHANSLSVAEPSECDVGGAIGSLCGTHSLAKVEKTGSWGLSATEEKDISISSVDLHYYFAGCLVPSIRIKGTITASPDKASAITKVTYSGKLAAYNALGEASGEFSTGGTSSVSPSGTYGVAPVPSTPTRWRMSNKLLTETGKLSLTGKLALSGAEGSVTCPVSAELSLTSGEVEEETPEGSVNSFTATSLTECEVKGTLASLCKKGLSKVEKTGTWDLTTNESDITVSGVDLDIAFKECAVTNLRMKGALTLTVTSPTAIEEASYGGILTAFNASEEKFGEFEASGAQSASPSGTFGIQEEPPPPIKTIWTKAGSTLFSNQEIHLEGNFGWSSETLGGVNCTSQATLTMTLTGGSHSAVVTEFTDASPTTDCHVGGFIESVCGAHSLTHVGLMKGGNATATASTGQIHFSELEFETEFGSCITLTLTGGFAATLDSTTAATTMALSGELETGGFGSVEISGDLDITASQAGVYGIEEVE